MRRFPVALLLAAALVPGCTGSSEESEEVPSMAYGRGGGLAGDSFAVEVAPDGRATVRTSQGIDERTIRFEVSGEELDSLVEHLEDADVGGLGQPSSDQCYDCFGYSLEFGEETASADSETVTEEFFDAADPLEQLLVEHLPQDARY